MNKSVEAHLHCFCGEKSKKWMEWVDWAEHWYNTSYHATSKSTPYQVVFGQPPPALAFYGSQKTSNATLNEQLLERTRCCMS